MSRSGYDDGLLTQVIGATDTALGEMQQLNSMVQGLAAQLPAVNNSTSGQKLAGLLGEWSGDYNTILTQLGELNTKAQGLLQLNRSTEADTSGMAN
ncbi:hypothetical protein BAY61_20815 [Prauserella marina]|uniref:Uncharacterized protein n=1 Tax=Prauserella marina TaxID=530584 RepID=A0A222VSX8_9PSEU|nr:hypothetical protein [Prauserella marina]ASR37019.1 hypothetical protein BAY61_20815 [Prauserella marina]PWV80006.1 hypothetical protein DES30_10392 [Prauserella marina]SDD85215.1 hypothetical protein SAMN05421630_113125 [Prauserella marina]